jgi:hypothetical protein
MRMRNRILSNSNKCIVMLKLVRFFYPHGKKMSLIESMVLRRQRHLGTLQRAHEGTKPVKKAKRQLIEGQLDRSVILDDEDPKRCTTDSKI